MCTQCARKGYVITSVQTVCEKCKGTARIPCATCGGTGLAPVASPQPVSAEEKTSATSFRLTDWLGVTSIDERGIDHGPKNMLGWSFLKMRGIARTYLTPSPAPTNATPASARTTS
jgi:hypothetical protein